MNIGIDGRFAYAKNKRGIGSYSFNLLNEILQNDLKNKYFIYLDSSNAETNLSCRKNVVVRTSSFSFYPFWEQLYVPICARRDELDIFHSMGNTGPIYLRKTTKLILTIHDVMFLKSIKDIPLARNSRQCIGRFYRRVVCPLAAKKAAAIITVSKYSKHDILKELKIKNQNVKVIYQGCSPVYVSGRIKKDNYFEEPFLLCFGADDPRKNTLNIIKGFLKAKNTYKIKEKLFICGYTNWNNSNCCKYVKDNNAESIVVNKGFIKDTILANLYLKATALLYLSTYEGFGVPVIEAYFAGCPVVASNLTSIPEIGGKNGFYIEPLNIQKIATAIGKICLDQKLQGKLKKYGLRRAQKFLWPVLARKTIKIYDDIYNKACQTEY